MNVITIHLLSLSILVCGSSCVGCLSWQGFKGANWLHWRVACGNGGDISRACVCCTLCALLSHNGKVHLHSPKAVSKGLIFPHSCNGM